jgi:DNA-binding NarL/FixJ family response regulator
MPVEGPLRVVLGEDSFLAREAITSVLAEVPEVELVASAGDLDGLRAAIDSSAPDVVLTDIRMPPTQLDEGVRLAQELRATHPETAVVLLSQFLDPGYAELLLEEGSEGRGYLLKERVKDRDELVRTLQTVAAGGAAIDPLVIEQLLTLRRDDPPAGLEELTPKELEVLALIAEGRSNAAIADSLVVTKRAVERHVNSIFAKLDLHEGDGTSPRVRAALAYLRAERPA